MFGRKARRIRELEAKLMAERRLDSEFLARVNQLEQQMRNEGADEGAQNGRTEARRKRPLG